MAPNQHVSENVNVVQTKGKERTLHIEDPPSRYTVQPILNKDIWDMYKKEALPATWFAEDINLARDVEDWENKLSGDERHFLTLVLAFFAGADKLVADNINMNFAQDVHVLEAEYFYDHQCFIERVHSEVYGNLIETYVRDPKERTRLFESLETIPVVAKKGAWALKYANKKTASFPERLIAFAIFEGIFFSGSFAAIFYMKTKGVLPGLCLSNDYISRDEALHCRFACLLYSHVIHRCTQTQVHAMFEEAVRIEEEFINEALRVELIGMKRNLMTQYIKFVADYWLQYLGYEKMFHVQNPFDWMHLISMQSKTNFFESRVTDYKKAGVGMSTEDNEFGFDDEF
jgi:ribonucleoside-diphosphate reductase beta chain